MDFSYLKRPSNEQIGVWGVTTLFTAWIVNRRPELFLNPSTNLRGIVLASVINGTILTLFHNALKIYFRPIEQEDPQKKKQVEAYHTCDKKSMERVRAYSEYQKAYFALITWNKDEGLQIQEQEQIRDKAFKEMEAKEAELNTKRRRYDQLEQDLQSKTAVISKMEEDLTLKKKLKSRKETDRDQTALLVKEAEVKLADIKHAYVEKSNEEKQYTKEARDYKIQAKSMETEIEGAAKTLGTHKLEKEKKEKELTKLSSALDGYQKFLDKLKIRIEEVKKTLLKQKKPTELLFTSLIPNLSKLKVKIPEAPDPPLTSESCIHLISWIENSLEANKSTHETAKTSYTQADIEYKTASENKKHKEELLRKAFDKRNTHQQSLEEYTSQLKQVQKQYEECLGKYKKCQQDLDANIQKCEEKYREEKGKVEKHEFELQTITLEELDEGDEDKIKFSFCENIETYHETRVLDLTIVKKYRKKDTKKDLSQEEFLIYLRYQLLKVQKERLKLDISPISQNIQLTKEKKDMIQGKIKELEELNRDIDSYMKQIHLFSDQIISCGNLMKSLHDMIEVKNAIVDILENVSLKDLKSLGELYLEVETLEKQQALDIQEQVINESKTTNLKVRIERLEKELASLEVSEYEQVFNEIEKKRRDFLEKEIVFTTLLKQAEKKKLELLVEQEAVIEKKSNLEARLSVQEEEVIHLNKDYDEKRQLYAIEDENCQHLSEEKKQAEQSINELNTALARHSEECQLAIDELNDLHDRFGFNSSATNQRAENARKGWKNATQDYKAALQEQAQLEYALEEYKLLSEEVIVLYHSIEALETQKIYYHEKSKDPNNALLSSQRHKALQQQREYLNMQIKLLRAYHFLAQSKRVYREFHGFNSEDILKAYKEEQLYLYQLEYYFEKLLEHDKIVEWEEEIESVERKPLQIQIKDSIKRQIASKRLLEVVDHLGYEIQAGNTHPMQFQLRMGDYSSFQDSLVLESLIALIEQCLVDTQTNFFDIIIELYEHPPTHIDLKIEKQQHPLFNLKKFVKKIKATLQQEALIPNNHYDELRDLARQLFIHLPRLQLELLIAKLDLLQAVQKSSLDTDNPELIKNECSARIKIADIMLQQMNEKKKKVQNTLTNKEQKVGEPPRQEISISNKVCEAIAFISPEILLLLLYKMQVIGKLLEKVGANITWSSAWKTCIWTFAIHSKSSYLLERDPRA